MPQTRERHNAKARRSVAGSRKKGKARVVEGIEDNGDDTNATVLMPKSKADREREHERRRRVEQELAAQADTTFTGKKKKRLEKYIDKKLKKEDRALIFEKLVQSQAQVRSVDLQSSATLGTGRTLTNRERIERQEDKAVRRSITGRTGKRKRTHDQYAIYDSSDSHDDDILGDADASTDTQMKDEMVEREPGPSRLKDSVVVDSSSAPPVTETPAPSSSVSGSALRRNADGTVQVPKLIKRTEKGQKTKFRGWKQRRAVEVAQDSDTSFDSSDSAYDTQETDESGIDDHDVSEEGGSEEDEDEDGESRSLDQSDGNSTHSKDKKPSFKDWALKQLSLVKDSIAAPISQSVGSKVQEEIRPTKRRKTTPSLPGLMKGPLGEDLQLPATSLAKHLQNSKPSSSGSSNIRAKAISVTRPSEVQEARMMLPIVAEEQPIMEAILLNPVVVICGETGSGKTTQVPQFLYEAGFGDPQGDNPGIIGVTQPRRVAAMSMASRVAHELSLTSSRVSFQIRYDATVSPSTTIKFMTDGVLLRELATDFLLTKYSVIIIDEAHERSMNTDILIGVLSRVVRLREQLWKEGKQNTKPLRLIIMSATLRVSDFAENTTLFSSPPPVINVSARQHPVTVHFNRRTPKNYINEAIKKASKIHNRLPPGGILIFLTGQNEITDVCRRLEARYGEKTLQRRAGRRAKEQVQSGFQDGEDQDLRKTVSAAEVNIEAEDMELGTEEVNAEVDGEVDDHADADALDSDDEQSELDAELGIDADENDIPMHIVPLYSLLPADKQMKVFQPPPSGQRLVVVATNVAETSITIPGIRYVIDCGRAKERRYDIANGIQAFQVSWTSKASAAQRAGRAGRTGPGHCYRLYSSNLFEHYFDSFAQPEILRMPIEGVVLQMKSMHIDSVVNFPFPTPPDRVSLRKAETVLTHLGALQNSLSPLKSTLDIPTTASDGQITALGRAMALFPLSPRYSKMLVSGQQHGCLPYIITVVSALSVGDPFIREEGLDAEEDLDDDDLPELSHIKSSEVKAKELRRLRRRAFFQSKQRHASLGQSTSDAFSMLSVVGGYEYAGGGHKFCAEHFVRPKAMEEIHKLRAQISNIVQINFPSVDTVFIPKLRPPSAMQLKVIRQLLAGAFIDQVAARKDLVQKESSTGARYATAKGVPYRAMGISEDVFIHPSSVVADQPPPEYVVFHEITRTTRPWLKGITVINVAWLSSLGRSTLCTFSKPAKNSSGILMTVPRFGPDNWELPPMRADI